APHAHSFILATINCRSPFLSLNHLPQHKHRNSQDVCLVLSLASYVYHSTGNRLFNAR
ncbi:uncharacterized protein BX663DRAFT_522590, partial [Cokeromyces recurvatus]|uniref:uncharacterized protein n=1 Tax=Cokeromyces recurvatus TaxID=90255 RepID=UPI002220463F